MTEPTLYPESGFLRLRIDLAYDGTNYSGWAKQPDRRTVQEEFENALSTILQSPAETIVAGRTDAGVHATGQVIHVDVPEATNLNELTFKLNQMLDEDIRINNVVVAKGAFHARFSATRRYYTYKILDGNRALPPLNRFDITPWYRTLDVELLNCQCFALACVFAHQVTNRRVVRRNNATLPLQRSLLKQVVVDARFGNA